MRCWRGYLLERSADSLHMVQLMPLPPYHVCFSKVLNGLSFWYRLTVMMDLWYCYVRYNVLFAFLLRVRRVQLGLQQCWALAMNRRHLRHAADSPSSTKWWLRNHMAFVVDNLQYYLQVVLSVIHSVLMAVICHIGRRLPRQRLVSVVEVLVVVQYSVLAVRSGYHTPEV